MKILLKIYEVISFFRWLHGWSSRIWTNLELDSSQDWFSAFLRRWAGWFPQCFNFCENGVKLASEIVRIWYLSLLRNLRDISGSYCLLLSLLLLSGLVFRFDLSFVALSVCLMFLSSNFAHFLEFFSVVRYHLGRGRQKVHDRVRDRVDDVITKWWNF